MKFLVPFTRYFIFVIYYVYIRAIPTYEVNNIDSMYMYDRNFKGIQYYLNFTIIIPSYPIANCFSVVKFYGEDAWLINCPLCML